MFTLCIPTMDRFDKYLKEYLPKYLENNLINEIIICDENGNDYKKILKHFNSDRIKLYQNSKILGPFLNKINVCKKSNNEWIAIIDSDNFADYDYFQTAKNFIQKYNPESNSIISPDYASTVFQWPHLSKNEYGLLNKDTYKELNQIDLLNPNLGKISHLLNTGNFIINKNMIDNINLDGQNEIIEKSSCFDVVLMNYYLFKQYNMNFYILNNMKYLHNFSNDSIYIKTIKKYRKYADLTYKNIYTLLS